MEKTPTSPPSHPITPRHAQLIDELLQLTQARLLELATLFGYAVAPIPLETLRQQPLAKALRVLARYAEGYDLGEGNILPHIDQIGRALFPLPLSQTGYRPPPDFHMTPLGELVHECLARHYPRALRMTVGEVTKALGVARQTVHGWAEDGTLRAIYERGNLTMLRGQVEQLRQRRADRARETGKPMEKGGNPGR